MVEQWYDMRPIRVITAACALSAILFMLAPVLNADGSPYWEVEEPSMQWNSVHGTVTGDIELEEGDSVGMFDKDEHCYGAGTYDGSSYHISAYAIEEADPDVSGDFTIEGFEDGEAVTFKVYQQSTGEITTVDPSGGSYNYAYRGKHPALNINLVLDSGDNGDNDDNGDNGGNGGNGDNGGGNGGSGSGSTNTTNGPWDIEDDEEQDDSSGPLLTSSGDEDDEEEDYMPPQEEHFRSSDDVFYDNAYTSTSSGTYIPRDNIAKTTQDRIYETQYLEEKSNKKKPDYTDTEDTPKPKRRRVFLILFWVISLLFFIVGGALVAREYYLEKRSKK